MGRLLDNVVRCAEQMTTYQWLWVGLVLAVVGLFCMRGVGSRAGY